MHPQPGLPKIIAHRGASCRWAEHTRAAYLQAIDDGADGLECDVQLTADGVAVCWHDATVDRTSNANGPLHDFTWAQLSELDVSSCRAGDVPASYGGPGDQLLAFEGLVKLARAAARPLELAVEFKHPGPTGFGAEDVALAVLRRAGWEPRAGRVGEVSVTMMSFDPGSLRHLAEQVPTRQLMLLTDGDGDPDDVLAGAVELGVGPSVAFVRAHRERVRTWVADGRRVRVWVVNDPDDLALCREVGAQEVTTNVPARFASGRTGRTGPFTR